MRNLKLLIVVAIGAFSGQTAAHTSLLTFEDLNQGSFAYDVMPTPYSGFSFTGWYYGPDTFYTPASGIIDLFTDYADPNDPGAYVITNFNNQITSTTDFIFDGAVFSGYSGVTFELWDNGVLVHTSSSLADALGTDPYNPTFLPSEYIGEVDKVVVRGVQGYYAMDDFTFHPAKVVQSVPEVETAALVLLGLAALIVNASKRTRSTEI